MIAVAAVLAAWQQPAPLLADAGTWIKLIFAAIAGLFWLINHFANNAKKQQQPVPRRPVPRPPVQPQQQQPVMDDVQEFLRRAAEQRQRAAAAQGKAEPARQQPPKRPPQHKPPKPAPTKARTIPKPVRPELVDEPMREATVGEHVRRHLDTREFVQRATDISHVAESPAQLDAHLHQVFDHRVGRLTTGTESDDDPATEGATAQTTPAMAIAAMLASPESARQAFVLAEILQRPEGRW